MDCMAGREEGGGGERGRGRGESPCGGHFILWKAEIYTQTAQVAGAGRRNPCCILHMLYSTCCTPHYVLYHTVTVYATQGHTMHATCNSMRLRAHMWTRRGFVGGGYRDGGAQGKGFKQGPACPACPGFDINLNPNPVSGPVAANSPPPQLKRDISCMVMWPLSNNNGTRCTGRRARLHASCLPALATTCVLGAWRQVQ